MKVAFLMALSLIAQLSVASQQPFLLAALLLVGQKHYS
jgi:hypothetical protein